MSESNERPAQNTDREIWREREGDYYADSIHVTAQGGIGLNCGGFVIVMPIRAWHALAKPTSKPKFPPASSPSPEETREPHMEYYCHHCDEWRVGSHEQHHNQPSASPPSELPSSETPTFDHSQRTERHWEPGIGPCLCEHCVKLPWSAAVIPPEDERNEHA